MPVAVAALAITNLQPHRAAQAVAGLQLAAQMLELLAQPILAAVVAQADFLLGLLQAAQAAPASSSSSTTSALPQSSPSSHRRSGLHQRVR